MKLTNNDLDEILHQGGLSLNQHYHENEKYRKDEYLFTKCLHCGVEAHYRLKYILDKNAAHEQVCRACYWLNWYDESNQLYDKSIETLTNHGFSEKELYEQGVLTSKSNQSWDKAERLADKHGYRLISLLQGNCPVSNIMVVQCKACGRQNVKRPEDIVFGCTCNQATLKSGIPFAESVKQPSVSLNRRKITPKTPGAASINSLIERRAQTPPKYTSSNLKGKTVADIPQLAQAWEDERSPEEIPVVTSLLCHFQCSNDHHPSQTPYSFLVDGCMVCRGLKTKTSANQVYLKDTNPELAEEWKSAVDGEKYTPSSVKSGSKRKVVWSCIACGYEWIDTVRNRELRMNNHCPECGKVMGSLAWQYPKLAHEWSQQNPVSPWNIKPYSKLSFKPEWVCSNSCNHIWNETVASRIKKNGLCPYCAKEMK